MSGHPATAAPAGGADLSYLPDASAELEASADLAITLEGATLPLHSQVLAAGSRVLRVALLSSGGSASAASSSGANSADQAAAVQVAFEGHSLADVTAFLRVLYCASAAFDMGGAHDGCAGLLRLADKLDAPAVLQACDVHLSSAATGNWVDWLVLADATSMPRLLRKAVTEVKKELVMGREQVPNTAMSYTLPTPGTPSRASSPRERMLNRLGGLSAPTCLELLKAMALSVSGSDRTYYITP